jgi:hypothetical protein
MGHEIQFINKFGTKLSLPYPFFYCNPSLRLVTKTRACKGVGQEGSSRVTFHAPGSARECEGMNPHTPK